MNCAYFHLWNLRQAFTEFNGCKQRKISHSHTQHHNQISRTNHEYHLAIWCFSQDTTTAGMQEVERLRRQSRRLQGQGLSGPAIEWPGNYRGYQNQI